MRGKVQVYQGYNTYGGITPAYAGKSSQQSDRKQDDQGSPPPMRGKAFLHRQKPVSNGITPAYAGKSFDAVLQRIRIRDHPRLCGEKTKKIPKQRYFFHQPASFSFSLQYT